MKIVVVYEFCFFIKEDGCVFLYFVSVNFFVGIFESFYFVFIEKVKMFKIFLRESIMIFVYVLLLFGGEIRVKYEW